MSEGTSSVHYLGTGSKQHRVRRSYVTLTQTTLKVNYSLPARSTLAELPSVVFR